MKQVQALQTELMKLNITVRNWKDLRLYFSVQPGSTAYIQFDAPQRELFPHVYAECSLVVTTQNPSQSIAWCEEQSKKIKHGLMKRIQPITGEVVCDDWREVVLL